MPGALVETFRTSLNRCLVTPNFIRAFYDRFMDSSEEVAEKFKHTEFPRQARVLADSLYAMAVAAESGKEGVVWKELDRLGARHSRGDLDIRPALYDTWLECLLAAAREFDPEFSPEIEAAWRETLAPGIDYLRSRYLTRHPIHCTKDFR